LPRQDLGADGAAENRLEAAAGASEIDLWLQCPANNNVCRPRSARPL
jgi:hypothetical protein